MAPDSPVTRVRLLAWQLDLPGLSNSTTVLITVFLRMNSRKMVKPLKALRTSKRKTTKY